MSKKLLLYSRVEKFWKNNKLLVGIVFISIIVSGIAKFTDSIKTIKANLFCKGCLFGEKIIQPFTQPFDTTKGSFNVLLFPFQPLEKCQYKKTNIENTIITRLLEMNERDSLNLQIKFDTLHCVRTNTDADSIGKKLNANLVIWGDLYERCANDTTEASLKFLSLPFNGVKLNRRGRGESDIEKIMSLSEVTRGKLQKDIDFVIYWIAAYRSAIKKDYTLALLRLKMIENSGDTTGQLFLTFAQVYFNSKNFSEAKMYYEKSLRLDSNFAPTHFDYAKLLSKVFNDYVGAKKQIEIGLQLDSSDANIIGLYAYWLWHRFNNIEGAKKQYERALSIDPNEGNIHAEYAYLLRKEFKDFQGAKEHYEKALLINPKSDGYYNDYAALLLEDLGDKLTAKKHFEYSLKINPNDARTQFNYGLVLEDYFKDFRGALEHYKIAFELDSNYSDAYTRHGLVLDVIFNDYVNAEKSYKSALKINPNDAAAHYGYSHILSLTPYNWAVARNHYFIAIRLDPSIKNIITDEFFGLNKPDTLFFFERINYIELPDSLFSRELRWW